MKYFIILVLTTIYCVSCSCNFQEDRRLKNFPREYTGLDTLIRIDGYYYHEDIAGLESPSPFVLSENSEFKVFFFSFETHREIQNSINRTKPYYGSYILTGDTTKI